MTLPKKLTKTPLPFYPPPQAPQPSPPREIFDKTDAELLAATSEATSLFNKMKTISLELGADYWEALPGPGASGLARKAWGELEYRSWFSTALAAAEYASWGI